MSDRTEPDHVTHRAGGAAAEPVCRRLFTIEQAAEFAHVPVAWIWDWIMAGELKAYRLKGGTRIDEVDLEKVVSAR